MGKLILTAFVEDEHQEGLRRLGELMGLAQGVNLKVFVKHERHELSGVKAMDRLPSRFNIIEGIASEVGVVAGSELRFRYRPAPSSGLWAEIGIPTFERICSEDESVLARISLAMMQLEHPPYSAEAQTLGVLQFFCPSLPKGDTAEESILYWAERLLSGMLGRGTWGIADVVPFRGLTSEEEWEVAMSILIEKDLSGLAGTWQQYVFAGPGTRPALPMSPTAGQYGFLPLSISRLRRPERAK